MKGENKVYLNWHGTYTATTAGVSSAMERFSGQYTTVLSTFDPRLRPRYPVFIKHHYRLLKDCLKTKGNLTYTLLNSFLLSLPSLIMPSISSALHESGRHKPRVKIGWMPWVSCYEMNGEWVRLSCNELSQSDDLAIYMRHLICILKIKYQLYINILLFEYTHS